MLFLDDTELDKLYPCRLVVDAKGRIEVAGPSYRRLLGRDIVGARFDDVFQLTPQRRGGATTYAEGQFRTPVTLTTRGRVCLEFRGAVIESHGRRHLLLGGVPDGKLEASHPFRYGDFAPTDGAIDMLLALQAHNASLEDARRLSERLVEARAAEAASVAKSRFLASMSHELRTPLNAIIGFTEIVIDDLADAGVEGSTDDLARVLRAATHLLGLVNDVLDLAKIEAGKMTVHPEAMDFAEIVSDIVGTLDPIARKAGDKLVVVFEGDTLAGVSDVKRVRQCLINLIGNALKFTRDGEVTVTLGVEKSAAREDVVIRVADTGIGMSPAQVERLFRPFVQATTDIASAFGGTGLGLVITQESVRLLGGSIAVESTPGVGSVFTLRAPRWLERPAQDGADAAWIVDQRASG